MTRTAMVRKASVNLCSPTMASASNNRTVTPMPTAMFVSHQGFRFRRPSNENSSWVIDMAQTLLLVSHRNDFADSAGRRQLSTGGSTVTHSQATDSIPQQFVDRGFGARLLVDALDDHRAVE